MHSSNSSLSTKKTVESSKCGGSKGSSASFLPSKSAKVKTVAANEKRKDFCKKNKYDPRYLETSDSGHVNLKTPPSDDLVTKNGEFIRNGRRYVRIVTREYVRDLVIPEPDDKARSLLLCKSELEKIRDIKEKEEVDKEAEMEKLREKFEREAAESRNRKRDLEEHFTSHREIGPTLEQLENTAKQKANTLLQKAKAVRQEDEDDIKLCNRLLLSTKCQAIRDVQIMERKQIQKELEEEERRLNEMMEQERLKKLVREKEELLQQVKKREEYVNDLNEQMKRNLLERETEAEKHLEEAMILNEGVIQAKIDHLREQEEKAVKKEKIRREINRMNEQILNQLDEEKEKAKLADLKIQELMKKKAEEQELREQKLKMVKREKEYEIAKLRQEQQTRADNIEKKNEENAQRAQRQYEEEWFLRERKAYENKIRANEKLLEDRRLQIEEKQRTQASEQERELIEVARIERLEESIRQREKEQTEQRKRAQEEYKAQLLKQMNEKEKERIAARKTVFEEGLAEIMDMKLKRELLKDNMKRKVEQIKTHKIPEKYIAEVENKLRWKTSTGYD